MKNRELSSKLFLSYPASSLLVLSLGATILLATGAVNLNAFEFLKFTAFTAVCGMAALGTSFSIEHQTTKNLTEKSFTGNIKLVDLLRSPLKKAIIVCTLAFIVVWALETFNRSDIYANLYFPLGIYLLLTFVFSALRGWAAALQAPIYLANANVLAGIGALVFPLFLLLFRDSLAAYIWGFAISFSGSICYLILRLYMNNLKPEFAQLDKVTSAPIDSKLTWSYQGLTVAYLGSTLIISSVHSPQQELEAAQAQLYLAGAKALPQILLGLISLGVAYLATTKNRSYKSVFTNWFVATSVTSLLFTMLTFLFMPIVILALTNNQVILESNVIASILLAMMLLSIALIFLPKLIVDANYHYIGVIWWSSGAVIAFGFTPFFPKNLLSGIYLVLISSISSVLLSFFFALRKSYQVRVAKDVL